MSTRALTELSDLGLPPYSRPIEELTEDAADSLLAARASAASNPDTSPEVLSALASLDPHQFGVLIARNPSCPPETLLRFAALPSSQLPGSLQHVVITHPRVPGPALALIAVDPASPYVLRRVAAHPATPLSTLLHLASFADPALDIDLASNSSLPPALLHDLYLRGGLSVEQRLVKNPSSPARTLHRIACDAPEFHRAIAAHPHVGRRTLRLIASHFTEDDYVRELVAAHPHTPPDVLAGLSRFHSVAIKSALAKNPATPLDVLIRLACSSAAPVRSAVATHPIALSDPACVLTLRLADSGVHRDDPPAMAATVALLLRDRAL